MGRANVQVVSTRAGLHSLAHRYGRTISVFTKVSSSDRIILNQYSIRGDALWYALPALRLADANSGSHRGSRRGPKDSRLPRPAIPASSRGSGSPQPTPQTRRILTAHRPPSPTCASRPHGSGPARRIAPFKSLCSPDNCSSGCPKSGFRGSGCRISASFRISSFRISAHSPIEKPRSILLLSLLKNSSAL